MMKMTVKTWGKHFILCLENIT